MKQLTFTSCRSGRSVSGESGFRVRAESADFPTEIRSAITDAGRYRLPEGATETGASANLPRQLAVVTLPNGMSAAVHTVAADPDPETNREGNFYLHAVVGTPTEVDPLAVIRSWGGPFWKTRDDEGPTTLAEVSANAAFTPGSSLSSSALATIGKQHAAALEFLLTALLMGSGKGQIFLAAPADAVAEVIFATLSVLPPVLRSKLTFSTYEYEPLTASPRIVATWWAQPDGRDLDEMCYTGSGVGYHTQTGRKSSLPPTPDYVRVAIQALQNGKVDELRGFFAEVTTNKITDGTGLALLHRMLYDKTPLTGADLRLPQALSLADRIVARPEVVDLLADATTDAAFLRAEFPKYVAALKKNEPVRTKLQSKLIDEALTAAKAGRTDVALARWTGPIPALDPAFDYRRWLLAKRLKFADFPGPVRLALLPKVLEVVNSEDKAVQEDWLSPGLADLAEVLKVLKKPAERRTVALHGLATLTRPEDLPAPAASALAADPTFAVQVTSEFPESGGAVLARLIASAPKLKWSAALFQRWGPAGPKTSSLAPKFLDTAMHAVLTHESGFDARHAVSELTRLAGGKGATSLPLDTTLPELARRVLADHPSEWQTDATLSAFLESVAASPKHGPQLGDEARKTIQARGSLEAFVKNPQLTPASLKAVAAALQEFDDTDRRAGWKKAAGLVLPALFGSKQSARRTAIDNVLNAILAQLGQGQSAPQQVIPWLRETLIYLGPLYGSMPLLTELFARAERGNLRNQERLLYSFLYFGLGDAKYLTEGTGFTTRDMANWAARMTAFYHKAKGKGQLAPAVVRYVEANLPILAQGPAATRRGALGAPSSGNRWYNSLFGQILLMVIVFVVVFATAGILLDESSVANFRNKLLGLFRR